MPARAMRSGGMPVMSRSLEPDAAGSGRSCPPIWLMRLVLPAPLGPMMTWRSPSSTVRLTSLVTTRLPNERLQMLDAQHRHASVPQAQAAQRAPDAAREIHHAGDEDQADDQRPMLGVGADQILHQQEHAGADRGPDQRPGAAQHRHDQHVAGGAPIERVRRDEAVEDGVEAAGEPGEGAADGEGQELVGARRIADGAHPLLVLADADEDADRAAN